MVKGNQQRGVCNPATAVER